MAGGLTDDARSRANGGAILIETVWNEYYVDRQRRIALRGSNSTGYLHNNTGSGGVDPSQPAPSYQSGFGLDADDLGSRSR